jgi:hypothetical protein
MHISQLEAKGLELEKCLANFQVEFEDNPALTETQKEKAHDALKADFQAHLGLCPHLALQKRRSEGSENHLWPVGVSDGTRTRDPQDHNLVLYQLNYTHHGREPASRSEPTSGDCRY